MSKLSTLPFLMAKAHANRSKSPSHQQIMAMLNAQDVTDIEIILQNTSYAEVVELARPSIDLPEFEKELRNNFARLLHLYRRAAPPKVAKLLDAYAIVIDAENINLIMQAIFRKTVNSELLNVITPVGKFSIAHYESMMNVSTIEIAADYIPYPRVRRDVKRALKKSDNPEEKLFYLSAALSHSSFAILHELAPKWIKNQIEFLNLETVCRAIELGIDAKDWMIPIRGVVNRMANILATMKTPREVISYVLPHFPSPIPLKRALAVDDENMVAVLEHEVLSFLHAKNKHRFYLVNQQETILDFFMIKMAEMEDITRILFSKLKGIPPEEIVEMLFLNIYKR